MYGGTTDDERPNLLIINTRPGVYNGETPDIVYSNTMISIEQKNYNYAARISLGEMTQAQSQFSFMRFSIFSSNLILHNLKFSTTETSTHDQKYTLLRYYDDSNKMVIIDNCQFEVDSGIFETKYLNGLTVQNSKISLTIPEAGFKIKPTSCYSEASTSQILFQNNTFIGENFNGVDPFFDISYGGPVTFTNNVFTDGFNSHLNAVNVMFEVTLSCRTTPLDPPQAILVTQNNFTGLNGVDIGFEIINGDDTTLKNTSVTITQNQISQSSFNSDLFILDAQAAIFSVVISENNITNCNFTNLSHFVKARGQFESFVIQNERLSTVLFNEIYDIYGARSVNINSCTFDNLSTGSLNSYKSIFQKDMSLARVNNSETFISTSNTLQE